MKHPATRLEYIGFWDTGYLPFDFQRYMILSTLLTGIWDTMFNNRDTAICPQNKKKTQSKKTNDINKKSFKVKLFHFRREAVCTRHGKFISTRTFRHYIISSLNAVITSPPKKLKVVRYIS